MPFISISSKQYNLLSPFTKQTFHPFKPLNNFQTLLSFSSSLLSQLLKNSPTISQLKQVHAQITICCPSSSSSFSSFMSSLIRSYALLGNLAVATVLFDLYPITPSTLVWNSMIQAHSKTPIPQKSLQLFLQMLLCGVPADEYTFTFVITACSRHPSLESGQSVHGFVTRNGYDSNSFVGNSLVNLYSVFCNTLDAQKVFDEMSQPDVVAWTSLIRGYVNCRDLGTASELFNKMPEPNDVTWAVMVAGYLGMGRYNDTLRSFHDMLQSTKVKPNAAILVCVLSACAHLGALEQGKWVHIYIDKTQVPKSSSICTALIDMYTKCGRVDNAKKIFENMSTKDVLVWTSMISGLSMHGHGNGALQIFNQMLSEGIKPDSITILGILNGCSHSGLIDEGRSIFKNMRRFWDIVPKIEHYGCYIDLLARGGRLNEAFEVVKNMPMEPDIIIWRALLSACRIHSNVDLAEKVIGHIVHLNPRTHSGGHTLLSNLYASVGQWDKVVTTRNQMDESRLEWDPGCSWIEIDGFVHEFLAADRLHPRILEIHDKLREILIRASTEGGYVPNTKQVLFDLIEEEKEQAISLHSEKLAIAFGLMSTEEGTDIRIVKNLRICEDCHSIMKSISKVFGREIVVRDRSRFHCFMDGSCSCLDYW